MASGLEAPRLVILTGASHTGKTSVAQELLRQASPPASYLSVDEILRSVLVRSTGNPWEQIPLAYELMRPQAEVLVREGWLTIVESTFTYVPESGEPEFHMSELQRLIEIAENARIALTLVQLNVPGEQLAERAKATGRLEPSLVRKTAELHQRAPMPDVTLRLDASTVTPRELAAQTLRGPPTWS